MDKDSGVVCPGCNRVRSVAQGVIRSHHHPFLPTQCEGGSYPAHLVPPARFDRGAGLDDERFREAVASLRSLGWEDADPERRQFLLDQEIILTIERLLRVGSRVVLRPGEIFVFRIALMEEMIAASEMENEP